MRQKLLLISIILVTLILITLFIALKVGKVCRLVACSDGLNIIIHSKEPLDEFIVEIRELEGPTGIIIHCFDKSLGIISPRERGEFPLDDELVDIVKQFSPTPNWCPDPSSGRIFFDTLPDSTLHQIALACSEPPDENLLSGTLCIIPSSKQNLYVNTFNFFPEETEITIHWLESTMTIRSTFVYRSFQPNGPGCEPTCR